MERSVISFGSNWKAFQENDHLYFQKKDGDKWVNKFDMPDFNKRPCLFRSLFRGHYDDDDDAYYYVSPGPIGAQIKEKDGKLYFYFMDSYGDFKPHFILKGSD